MAMGAVQLGAKARAREWPWAAGQLGAKAREWPWALIAGPAHHQSVTKSEVPYSLHEPA